MDVESYHDKMASSDNGSNEQAEADDSPWEISSNSDDEDDYCSNKFPGTQITTTNNQEHSQLMLVVQRPNKEMPNLLESIGFVISCLYQLPLTRVATLHPFKQKSLSIDTKIRQSYDLRYVEGIFPHLAPNVAKRIAIMISRHRLRISSQLSGEDSDSLNSSCSHVEFDPLITRQIREADAARK